MSGLTGLVALRQLLNSLLNILVLTWTIGTYQPGDWLMFGAETTGLPKEVCCSLPNNTIGSAITLKVACINSATWKVSSGPGLRLL